jgi:hypothetical protein
MENRYWHVAYNFVNHEGSGMESIEITTKGMLIPHTVTDFLKKENKLQSCVLVNWIELDRDQLRYEKIK